MFKNYLTVAVRNLIRHKMYSFINILGLAIGMAICVLILLYVRDEMGYERHHRQADRIYRVLRKTTRDNAAPFISTGTDGPVGPALLESFPEVQQAVRVFVRGDTWVHYRDKGFVQTLCVADASLLDVFTLPLVKGDPKSALKEPSSVLITETTAARFFGNEDPVGKVIIADHSYVRGNYRITGVLKDMPKNSEIFFDFLTTTLTQETTRNIWIQWRPASSWNPLQNYVLLSEGASKQDLERKLSGVVAQRLGPEVGRLYTYYLQPLKRIHLYSQVDYGIPPKGDIFQVYALAAIALFILLIACINFINLSTARSINRAREIGIRKVVGAFRSQLIRQFLLESILLSFLSFLVSFALLEMALPHFNAFTDKSLSLNVVGRLSIPGLFGLVLFVGILAGSYPAFFFSGFQPIGVLKGSVKTGPGGSRLRKGLVIFQFAASIALIIGTSVVYFQLKYIRTKDLGFRRAEIIIMPIFWQDSLLPPEESKSLTEKYKMVKQEFSKHPNVLGATVSGYLPGMVNLFGTFRIEGKDMPRMHVLTVDEDFLKTYDIDLVAGRSFSEGIPSDAAEAFILNETAVHQLGLKDPVGKEIEWPSTKQRGRIIGVVKDFHIRSLREPLGPFVLCISRDPYWLAVRIRPENIPAILRFLESKWKEFIPGRPFEFQFLNERFEKFYYASEERLSRMVEIASLLAIFVSCLGLFGLAAFTLEQRTKEIGIRKVLGASVANIVMLLSKEFVLLVGIANLIAWPMAYYAMSRWLQDFAYRIDLGPGVFLLGGVLALLIALLTISAQVIRAARANPVDALRYE